MRSHLTLKYVSIGQLYIQVWLHPQNARPKHRSAFTFKLSIKTKWHNIYSEARCEASLSLTWNDVKTCRCIVYNRFLLHLYIYIHIYINFFPGKKALRTNIQGVKSKPKPRIFGWI